MFSPTCPTPGGEKVATNDDASATLAASPTGTRPGVPPASPSAAPR